MQRKITVVLVALLVLSVLCVPAGAVSASAWILYNPDTGDVLEESNADEARNIASVTKLMTALVIARECDMQDRVTVSEAAAGVEGSSIGIYGGQSLTVETLLYGLLLESGNDAAAALAIHVSGSTEAFATRMNLTAQKLGCRNTMFQNPHGLTQEGHYSCARDLALIMAAAMEEPTLAGIMAAETWSGQGFHFENHNQLLSLYAYTVGGKTGYTQAAGRTLVSCAEKDGVRLICVTLNDGDDWNDHIALYESGFSRYRTVTVIPEGAIWRVPVVGGEAETASVSSPEVELSLLDGQTVSASVCLPKFVYAEIQQGDTLGYAEIAVSGGQTRQVPLTAICGVSQSAKEKCSGGALLLRQGRLTLLTITDAIQNMLKEFRER